MEQELFEVESEINNLSEMLASRNNEIELYKEENYLINREVEQLKKQLR